MPSQVQLQHDVGAVAMTRTGKVDTARLPGAGLGGFGIDDPAVLAALGIDKEAMVYGHMDGAKLGVSVRDEASKDTRFAASVDLAALGERIWTLLSKLGVKVRGWLERRKKKDGPGFLAKLFEGLKDGALWFGEKAIRFGIKIAEAVKRLLTLGAGAADLLLGLLPDTIEIPIGWPEGLTPRKWTPSFEFPDLELPNLGPMLEALGLAAGAAGRAVVKIAMAAGDALSFAVGVVIDGAKELWVFLNAGDLIGRLLKTAGALGKAFLEKLKGWKPGGGGASADVAVTVGKDWMLRVHDKAWKNQLGFDLKRLLCAGSP